MGKISHLQMFLATHWLGQFHLDSPSSSSSTVPNSTALSGQLRDEQPFCLMEETPGQS
jgi:hypothetical protein